ncbi:hypothetical protein [Streptomyces sp. NBC_00557]|uniref:hypothetical protein n=1 Tax=Streptomyces sp. NBC_00557 TaxID=2975776 RepID=UPI002E810E84|nr:hypothetical protein [Streptomyces sp. NBC_00557]WUC35003.1 hypothetical protein OG956_12630 [Streptomyces sp. NBC_00557]
MNRIEHYVLDSPTLLVMGGNKQVSGLIHAAASSDDVRLWAPILCPVEAERERPGIVAHVGVLLDVIHVVDDDFAMAATVAELLGGGVASGVAAAVHVARPNLMLPDGALVATVAPEAYARLGVGVMDLNR